MPGIGLGGPIAIAVVMRAFTPDSNLLSYALWKVDVSAQIVSQPKPEPVADDQLSARAESEVK
jgi:hypothetical protein